MKQPIRNVRIITWMRKPKGLFDDFKAELIKKVREVTAQKISEVQSKGGETVQMNTTPKPKPKTLKELFAEVDKRTDLSIAEKLALKHKIRFNIK